MGICTSALPPPISALSSASDVRLHALPVPLSRRCKNATGVHHCRARQETALPERPRGGATFGLVLAAIGGAFVHAALLSKGILSFPKLEVSTYYLTVAFIAFVNAGLCASARNVVE